MADDPYTVLGIGRDATEDAIRKAYRSLAKKHHPDLNPGDKAAEERFKAISAANSLLSDPEQRGRFDRGEIDAAGQPRAPQPSYRDYAETDAGGAYAASGRPAGGWTRDDWGDIFGDMFGSASGARASGRPGSGQGGFGQGGFGHDPGPRRGRDDRYALTIDFLDAVRGSVRRLAMPDGGTLDVTVPPGIDDGQILRLRGRGGAGQAGGEPGDALIEIHVAPHPFFRREGNDIHLDLPVTLREAVLGERIEVPTPGGPVAMTIPKRAETGRRLRLRGRGIPAAERRDGVARPAGDLHVTLRVAATEADDALEAFLRDWKPEAPAEPRRGLAEPGAGEGRRG